MVCDENVPSKDARSDPRVTASLEKWDRNLESQEASERPNKRRRLDIVQALRDSSDSEDLDLPSYGGSVKDVGQGSEEEDLDGRLRKTKAQERQGRIHIPRNTEMCESIFVTQLTQPKSSPSRIRGPRWKKKSPIHDETGTQERSSLDSAGQDDVVPMASASMRPQNGTDLPLQPTTTNSEFLNEIPPDLEFAFDTSSLSGDETRLEEPSQAQVSSKILRQSTLFGSFGQRNVTSPGQTPLTGQKWPSMAKVEPPTHHRLEADALKTWVYPTNLGHMRDYQFNIVRRGLFHNLLVALPTGLGKTFIAATIMLNWFRWTTEAQIIFVAPTKPLVSQQVDACFGIVGIPRSSTSMLTGNISPALRAEEWQSKRVFFMTPQTLIRDLKNGICDPKKIVLLVVDEAHRATGSYAYVEIVKFLRRFNTSFRVLALTATPGSSVETVQNVIDGLDISRVEIRTENSLDIRQFVHARNIELEILDRTDEMAMIMDLFSNALQPILNRLNTQNAYWGKDPMQLTAYGLTKARQQWNSSDAGRKASGATKAITNRIFTLLASLAHAIELLKFYSIGSFHHKLEAFNDEDNGKYAREVQDHTDFKVLMERLRTWTRNDDFIGHPKLSYLKEVVLNHFLDAGEGAGAASGRPPSDTRIMVFVHYRDCAEEVVRVLKQHEPMIRPHVFVGQAAAKGSEGMDQKSQLDIVNKFKRGTYNTIVATSIGEEGLDIGEVDLIVCYDSSSSPIRMLQRMGRTGRRRSGNVILLLMRGREEESYLKAKDNYEKIQQKIARGSEFHFHDDRSPRIVPKDVQPLVDKREIEIPTESTQIGLPEPKRRAKSTKKPQKKFHMPDGVETGFVQASRLGTKRTSGYSNRVVGNRTSRPETASLPSLDSVILSPDDSLKLEQRYCQIQGPDLEYFQIPRFGAFFRLQRNFRPFQSVGHGQLTGRLVAALGRKESLRYPTLCREKEAPDHSEATLARVENDPEIEGSEAGSSPIHHLTDRTNHSRSARADLRHPQDVHSEEITSTGQVNEPQCTSQKSIGGSVLEDLPDVSLLFHGTEYKQGREEDPSTGGKQQSTVRKQRRVLHEEDDDD